MLGSYQADHFTSHNHVVDRYVRMQVSEATTGGLAVLTTTRITSAGQAVSPPLNQGGAETRGKNTAFAPRIIAF